MTNARTTVVIPLYNGAAHVAAALDSIFRQSVPGFEVHVLVIDDGSSDGGQELVRSRYPDVEVVSIPNSGEAYARNVGLARATSEYVTFLDQDDVWHRDHLKILFDELEATGARAIVPGLMSFGTSDVVGGVDLVCSGDASPSDWPTPHRLEPIVLTIADLRSRTFGNSALAKRDEWIAIGGFPVAVPGVGDFLALWNFASRSVLARSAHRTVAYRVHPGNSTWSYDMGHRLLAVRSMLACADDELRGCVWDSGSIGFMVERRDRPVQESLRLAMGYAMLLRPPLRALASETRRGLRRRVRNRVR